METTTKPNEQISYIQQMREKETKEINSKEMKPWKKITITALAMLFILSLFLPEEFFGLKLFIGAMIFIGVANIVFPEAQGKSNRLNDDINPFTGLPFSYGF